MTRTIPPECLSRGTLVGPYAIESHLASGGMADVYLARDTTTGTQVALKCLRDRHRSDKLYRVMMADEAVLLGRLTHPHIVRVHAIDTVDQGYFAMEYVRGVSLGHVLATSLRQFGRLPINIAVAIMCRVTAALHYAHELRDDDGDALGIIHRDISPGNVLVGVDGSVKLADFGVARSRRGQQETGSGLIKGKVGYMSPEQVEGRALDRRSDVFAVGIVLHELLCGRRLFKDSSEYGSLYRIVNEDVSPPSASSPRVPGELDAIVLRALCKAPQDRFQDANELHLALAEFATDRLVTTTDTISEFMVSLLAARRRTQGNPRRRRPPTLEMDPDTLPVEIPSIAPDTTVEHIRVTAQNLVAAREYAAAVGTYEYLLTKTPGDRAARAGYYEATGQLALAEGREQAAARYFAWARSLCPPASRGRHGAPAAGRRRHTTSSNEDERPLAIVVDCAIKRAR